MKHKAEPGRLSPVPPLRHSAVIIVDMQRPYLDNIPRKSRKRLIGAHEKLLGYCAENDVPVVELRGARCGLTIAPLRHALKAVPTRRTLVKKSSDGFEDGRLDAILNGWSVPQICFAGVYGSGCVLGTAESALPRGVRVIAARDIIGDINPDMGETTRRWFLNYGAWKSSYTGYI